MNKVTTINLGGAAFQLEESGYDALRAYLENGAARLQGNPDREEILSDIERAIADKFRALLSGHKNVVEAHEVTGVLAAMGPIEGASAEPCDASPATAPGTTGSTSGQGTRPDEEKTAGGPAPRRLYRIEEGEMFFGVCNGLAAYFDLDPTVVRLAFVLLLFFGGSGVLIYLVLAFVIPEAETPEQMAAAHGSNFPETAQEFIRRAKAGYYAATKNFPDRQARREWQRRFKRNMRAHACRWSRGSYWQGWRGYYDPSAPVHPGMGFTLPALSLVQAIVTVFCICTVVSLLGTGAVLGHALPANVPVWLAVVFAVMAFGLISTPLNIARRACYWWLGRPNATSPAVHLLDALIWLAVVIVLMVLAIHYFPQVKDALTGLPGTVHQAITDVHEWWKNQ